MNAVMMYMSGNTLQIFSIMMVFMLFKSPVQALLQTNQVFTRFETEGTKGKMVMVKATYVAMNLLALCLGLWKVNGMGLFPYDIHSRSSRLLADKLIERRGRIGLPGRLNGCRWNKRYLLLDDARGRVLN